MWSQAPRCFGVATYQSAGPTVSGDLGGYRTLGVPMTQMIQSGTFYHSSGDVFEAVPAEGIERAARFHAFFIEQADQAAEALITAGKGTPIHRRPSPTAAAVSCRRPTLSVEAARVAGGGLLVAQS